MDSSEESSEYSEDERKCQPTGRNRRPRTSQASRLKSNSKVQKLEKKKTFPERGKALLNEGRTKGHG